MRRISTVRARNGKIIGSNHGTDNQKEIWSRRPTNYSMSVSNKITKKDTHKCERRMERKEIEQEINELNS